MSASSRTTSVVLTAALMLGAVASRAGADPAFVPPWKVQFSLSPPYGPSGLPINVSGLQILSPDNGNSETLLGLQGEFGYLVTPMLEPSVAVSISRLESGGLNVTEFSLVPSLKINYFMSAHVGLFVQPFAGLMALDNGNSTNTFSDIGVFGGIEGLVTSWGIRVFTGVEWAHGDFSGTNHDVIGFPIRWALFAYF